jgi:NAD(P)-dependent dehydrogenase (short-subunit alcohol dehydrogenase family)
MEKKVVLVTDANRGIGKEICRQLAERDWQVIVASRKLEAANPVCEQIGHEVFPVQLDVSDQESVRAAAETVNGKFGTLNVLVNNAAIMGNSSMRNFDLKEIEDAMDTNFLGPIRTSKYFLPEKKCRCAHHQPIERNG